MSSLQDLAAEYGIDELVYDQDGLENVHSMDWVNEDLHGLLDYSSLRSGTRSRRVICSIGDWDMRILLWWFL